MRPPHGCIKAQIIKLKREVDGLNQGMIRAGVFPESTMKLLSDREADLAKLEASLEELKNSSGKGGNIGNFKLDSASVEQIRRESLATLDNQNPEDLRIFLRNYIEWIRVKDNTVNIKFAFKEKANSCQEMVAGVGFEPTTFGL